MINMNYEKHYGKRVRIIFLNGHEYTGLINDYTSDADNDNQGEYWGLLPDGSRGEFVFYPDEVKNIKLID